MNLRAKTMEAGYAKVMRPLLFRSNGGDPEQTHHQTLERLAAVSRNPRGIAMVRKLCAVPTTPITVAGIEFPGRVGLAAGVDKDGVALGGWSALGFSHVELGTVTPREQPGNGRPRLFRVVESGGIINRMGFNNNGVDELVTRIDSARHGAEPLVPIGVSIGKNASTRLDTALEDYLMCLRTLHGYADYIAVNVSSPNTAGLRGLQGKEPLGELLASLVQEAAQLAAGDARPPVPIFVKIAPDLSNDELDDILEVVGHADVAGIIATNTTLSRDGLKGPDLALVDESGGLSGTPLTRRTRRIVRYVTKHTSLPVIGVGGIMSVDDGMALIDAGASLLQIYTGFVYSGPALVRDLNLAIG